MSTPTFEEWMRRPVGVAQRRSAAVAEAMGRRFYCALRVRPDYRTPWHSTARRLTAYQLRALRAAHQPYPI